MTANQLDLGGHLGTHRAAGGFTGFQNSQSGRNLFLTIAGAVVGLIPGLFIALIADLVIALVIGPIIGGAVAYAWSRRNRFEAAVTEARLHERDRSALVPAAALRDDPHLEMHTRGG